MAMIIPAWLLAVAAVSAASAGTDEAREPIQVLFDGEPGTRFQASWQLDSRRGERLDSGEWQGEVPQRYSLQKGRLSLAVIQLSEQGRLEVTVISGGNRSHSSTQGKGSRMQLSVQ